MISLLHSLCEIVRFLCVFSLMKKVYIATSEIMAFKPNGIFYRFGEHIWLSRNHQVFQSERILKYSLRNELTLKVRQIISIFFLCIFKCAYLLTWENLVIFLSSVSCIRNQENVFSLQAIIYFFRSIFLFHREKMWKRTYRQWKSLECTCYQKSDDGESQTPGLCET